MSNAPQPSPIVCHHERRPGTTVCLHCRHAERIAALERRKRLVLRAGVGMSVVLLVVAAGALSATALHERATQRAVAPTQTLAMADVPIEANPPTLAVVDSAVHPHEEPVAARAPLTSVLPVGESSLHDGVTVTRTDSIVTLSFDVPMVRTRIPDKFEHFVRTTLPAVYGPAADSILAKLPEGAIVAQGNLLSELPQRGIQIPIDESWMIQLFPETRPGQDGPLVVRYRTAVVHRS